MLGMFYVNKGDGIQRHLHQTDHSMLCASGSCIVRFDDHELVMDKNSEMILFPANVWHEIEALEDNTIFINVM